MGKYEDAEQSLRASLDTVARHNPDAGARADGRACGGWVGWRAGGSSRQAPSCHPTAPPLDSPPTSHSRCLPPFRISHPSATPPHHPQAEEHMLTVQQRLGMVMALLGQTDEGRRLLHEVAPALGACAAPRAPRPSSRRARPAGLRGGGSGRAGALAGRLWGRTRQAGRHASLRRAAAASHRPAARCPCNPHPPPHPRLQRPTWAPATLSARSCASCWRW